MSDRVGNVSFDMPQPGEMVMDKPYSEHTAQIIDEEVRLLISKAYDRTYKLLDEHRPEIVKVITFTIMAILFIFTLLIAHRWSNW